MLPVAISGKSLREAGTAGRVHSASLRVVGPGGDIPCQIDERDGTRGPIAHPDHVLDDDDELVLSAELSGDTHSLPHIYFSRHPQPPGRYETSMRYGRPSVIAITRPESFPWGEPTW